MNFWIFFCVDLSNFPAIQRVKALLIWVACFSTAGDCDGFRVKIGVVKASATVGWANSPRFAESVWTAWPQICDRCGRSKKLAARAPRPILANCTWPNMMAWLQWRTLSCAMLAGCSVSDTRINWAVIHRQKGPGGEGLACAVAMEVLLPWSVHGVGGLLYELLARVPAGLLVNESCSVAPSRPPFGGHIRREGRGGT